MSEPRNRFQPVARDVQFRPVWPLAAALLAFAMAALTVIRFWCFSAPFPPGLDGAQWLSYGRGFFGGTARSTESTYAPLIPVLAHSLSRCLGPLLGLRFLAAFVLVLLAAAVWLLGVRALGVAWGSLTTALVLPCTSMAEPFFYGGYPQQAALAFGFLGMAALVSANRVGTPGDQARSLAFAATFFLLASTSHLLFGPLLLASGALVVLVFGVTRLDRRRFVFRATLSLAPALAACLAVAVAFVKHGYTAPLAVSQRTLPEAWGYATRESPVFWAVIVVGGMLSSSVIVSMNTALFRARHLLLNLPYAVIVGFALATPGAVLFIVSGQPRLAPPLLLGGAMLIAFACRITVRTWDRAMPVALAAWSVGILWLAGTTTGLTREFASYYQVVDASLVAATRSLPASRSGSIAVPADRRGWPVGWWVEALQERPVFTGSNPQWLAFPDEGARAGAAAELFASPDLQVLQGRARDLGVAYLLLRKWDWIGWERWIDTTPNRPEIIYDDNETVVLDIFPIVP